ncbi:MAG TPA: hypothetical protein VIM64_15990, partial [Puia sp.]
MNKQLLLISLLVFQFLSQGAFAQRTFYVDATRTTNGDGSIGNPWNNLLSGIYGTPQADTSDV